MNYYFKELHFKYKDSVEAFLKIYNYQSDILPKVMDSFFRTCALTIWKSEKIDIELCTKALNQIYTKEKDRKEFKEDDVKEAINFIDDKNLLIKVPDFFVDIVEQDNKNKTNYSRKFATGFELILLFFSLIDDSVSFNEAKVITEYYQLLNDYCNKKSIVEFGNNIDIYSYIKNNTVDNNSNYKKNDTDVKKEDYVDSSAEEDLNDLIGLERVKKEILALKNFINIQRMRKESGLPNTVISNHLVFTGPPGTGKTTVARIVAKIYKELGVISKGQLIEVDRSDLVAGYVGQTAIKTQSVIDKALGGVLFIDEAYMLDKNDNPQDYGQEAIDTLIKAMEDHRNDLVVIVAGYTDLMEGFINSNPGLKSRFTKFIEFKDYSADELYQIFKKLCDKNKYKLNDDSKSSLLEYFTEVTNNRDKNFGNARFVRNYFETVIANQANRISYQDKVDKESLVTIDYVDLMISKNENKKETLDDVLKELNNLIGLNTVKSQINDLIQLVKTQKAREEKGLTNSKLSLHLVFSGSPGTGKTTVARLIGRIYKCLGLLKDGHLIEVDRSDLVAGYVGQTAIKTQSVINKALGGVLFVDEAYSLSNNKYNDYGEEAIDILLKSMEDNRDNLVVIVAGYTELMKSFINSNPGLKSRFNTYIDFQSYTVDELVEIFEKYCNDSQYTILDDALIELKAFLSKINTEKLGNARGVRNIYEKAIVEQAKRLNITQDLNETSLSEITRDDIREVIKKYE